MPEFAVDIPQKEAKKQSYGLAKHTPEGWERKLEDKKKFEVYSKFVRRNSLLISSAAGVDIDKRSGFINAWREWKADKTTPESGKQLWTEELTQVGFKAKSIIDVGAGAGITYGMLLEANVFPSKLGLMEPNRAYYNHINARIKKSIEDGKVELVELNESLDKAEYKLRSVDTRQDFTVISINGQIGRADDDPFRGEKFDGAFLSGVSGFYNPEQFAEIINSVKKGLNDNGRVSFSYTEAERVGLLGFAHKLLKKLKNQDYSKEYRKSDLDRMGKNVCKSNVGDNFICTLDTTFS